MYSVNEYTVRQKLDAYFKTSAGINKCIKAAETTGNIMAFVAGMELKSILIDQIEASAGDLAAGGELGPTAVSAVQNIRVSNTKYQQFGYGYHPQVGKLGGTLIFSVDLTFLGDKSRPSVAPEKYGGVNNIVALLNSGYGAGGRVVGPWHGSIIETLQYRSGAHFIETATMLFTSAFASKYKPMKIDISNTYV